MILVVDDNPDISLLLQRMLHHEGFDAATVNDGVAALEYVETHRPLCIVLDLSMPDMSGLEVLRAIRDNRRYGEPKVLIFSAFDGKLKEEALAAGADGYVMKASLDWLNIIDWVRKWCPPARPSLLPPKQRNDRDVC